MFTMRYTRASLRLGICLISLVPGEDMITDIAPKGRASLPEKLKVEVFNRLRHSQARALYIGMFAFSVL